MGGWFRKQLRPAAAGASSDVSGSQNVIATGRGLAVGGNAYFGYPQPLILAPSPADTKEKQVHHVRLFLDRVALGISLLWLDKTFIFLECRILSPSKITSIISITPSVQTSDGKTWMGDCLDILSGWLVCPDKGADAELEPCSLMAKLKKGHLAPQIQERGWLGIAIPIARTTKKMDSISSITIALTDGGEDKHEFTFTAPWPLMEKSSIVAKHLREPSHF